MDSANTTSAQSQGATPSNTFFPKIVTISGFIVAYKKYLKENLPTYGKRKQSSVVKLIGAIKLHGTHVDIVVYNDNSFRLQSRHQSSLNYKTDVYGCARILLPMHQEIIALRDQFVRQYEVLNGASSFKKDIPITIAGEWVGPKIQRGVALEKLPKKAFVIIEAKINDAWVPINKYAEVKIEEKGFYNISRATFGYQTIDVYNPEAAKKKIEELTLRVERECPFAKTFGIKGVGEGIVWKPINALGADSKYWFKIKGTLHRESTADGLVKGKGGSGKTDKEKGILPKDSTSDGLVKPKNGALNTGKEKGHMHSESMTDRLVKAKSSAENISKEKGTLHRESTSDGMVNAKSAASNTGKGKAKGIPRRGSTSDVLVKEKSGAGNTGKENGAARENTSDRLVKEKSEPHKAGKGKAKGTQHKNSPSDGLVKEDSDAINIEKEMAKIFAQACVGEARLNKGWDYVVEMGLEKGVGKFTSWLQKDIAAEERANMQKLHISARAMNNEIANIARKWYTKKRRN